MKNVYDCMSIYIDDQNHINDEIQIFQLQTDLDLTIINNPVSDILFNSQYGYNIIGDFNNINQKIYLISPILLNYIYSYLLNNKSDDNLYNFFQYLIDEENNIIMNYGNRYQLQTYDTHKYLFYTLEAVRERYKKLFIYLYSKRDSLDIPLKFEDRSYDILFIQYYNWVIGVNNVPCTEIITDLSTKKI